MEPTADPGAVWTNGSVRVESQDELNARYAEALLPLTAIFGVFAFVGLVGNGFVLVVFTMGRVYRRSNFRVFVLCLGIIDFLTSTFLIPAEMIKHRNYFAFESLFMCKTKCLFNVWAGIAAALSLLIICIDRFLKVVLPLRKQISPTLAVRLCVILSFAVPVVLSIPGAVMCGVLPKNITNIYNTQTEVNVCATEPRFEKTILRVIYKFMFIILLVGVSSVTLIMYILIARQIIKHWGSTPVSFRKDSGKEMNSDISSDTFGFINRSSGKKAEQSTSSGPDSHSNNSVPTSPIQKDPEDTESTKKRPPLVHQGSSFDIDVKKAKKSLIKQLSSSSFSSNSKKSRRGSLDSSSRSRTMSRQGSSFGLRRFPYKTLIWFILTLVFIVTYMLYLVLAVNASKNYDKPPQAFAVFSFFYRLYFINNIVNPVIYGLLDGKFRKASREIGPTIKAKLSNCCS